MYEHGARSLDVHNLVPHSQAPIANKQNHSSIPISSFPGSNSSAKCAPDTPPNTAPKDLAKECRTRWERHVENTKVARSCLSDNYVLAFEEGAHTRPQPCVCDRRGGLLGDRSDESGNGSERYACLRCLKAGSQFGEESLHPNSMIARVLHFRVIRMKLGSQYSEIGVDR